MERLEFRPPQDGFFTPQIFEDRMNHVDALLNGEGLRLDDLEIQRHSLLGLGRTDLGTYIGLLAISGRLQIEPHHNPDGTYDCDVIKYLKGRKLLDHLEDRINERAVQARSVLSQRQLIPEQYRY